MEKSKKLFKKNINDPLISINLKTKFYADSKVKKYSRSRVKDINLNIRIISLESLEK